jgi:Flp pilus assembly protein TadG
MHAPVHQTKPQRAAATSAEAIRFVVSRLRGEQGQAIVELAFALPILLLAVVGIVSFGRAMNYSEQGTHLVNEAARYATVDQVPANAPATLGGWVRSQVDSRELANGTGAVLGAPTVCVSFPNGTSNVGDPVTVQMSFRFAWLPILHVNVLSTQIVRTATMRIEVPPTASFYASGCT